MIRQFFFNGKIFSYFSTKTCCGYSLEVTVFENLVHRVGAKHVLIPFWHYSVIIFWINFQRYRFNSFTASGHFCQLLITSAKVWTQIRPDTMLSQIWIHTVWHSDGIPEIFFEKVNLKKKKIHRWQKSMQNYQAWKELTCFCLSINGVTTYRYIGLLQCACSSAVYRCTVFRMLVYRSEVLRFIFAPYFRLKCSTRVQPNRLCTCNCFHVWFTTGIFQTPVPSRLHTFLNSILNDTCNYTVTSPHNTCCF